MVLPYDNNIWSVYEKNEPSDKRNYLQNTSGLFLNSTSIISVTCSRNKQELEKANRLTGGESPTKSNVKVEQKQIQFTFQLAKPLQLKPGEILMVLLK